MVVLCHRVCFVPRSGHDLSRLDLHWMKRMLPQMRVLEVVVVLSFRSVSHLPLVLLSVVGEGGSACHLVVACLLHNQ